MHDSSPRYPVLVVGEGWAAVCAASSLLAQGVPVVWIQGKGTEMRLPLPALPLGSPDFNFERFLMLLNKIGIDQSEAQIGLSLRQYRNKAFREPASAEFLWEPERRWVGPWDLSLPSIDFGGLERQMREKLGCSPLVTRFAGVPLIDLSVDVRGHAVAQLADGQRIESRAVVFGDRMSSLLELPGAPRIFSLNGSVATVMELIKKWRPVAAIQLVLSHEPAMDAAIQSGFLIPLDKNDGGCERNIFGYLTQEGRRSIWTHVLKSEEAEDSFEIAKRLRRIKQVLNRTLTGDAWQPAGHPGDFLSTVREEIVLFEEESVFSGLGSPESSLQAINTGRAIPFTVIPDGFGPTWALEQALALKMKVEAPAPSHELHLHPPA